MRSAATPRVKLHWPGKAAPSTEQELSVRLELVREGHPSCMLVSGDNLLGMQALAERGGPRFALVYLDPPFFTGRPHLRVTRAKDKETGRIVRTTAQAFDDRWDGLDDYLSALAARVAQARKLLIDEGCLVLHVDPKTSHYAKVLCDEIFGPGCFASEIVWRYRRWPAKTQNFQRVHDVLLRYVASPDAKPRFCQLYEPLAPSTLATWGDRRQRAVVGDDGRRVRSTTTKDASPGTPMGDVWDIGIVAPVAHERTGYPTQKPEALLERLISACTEPGDAVLDPYAGSGTTLAVAQRLGRDAVGIDSSLHALKVTRRRLRALGIKPLEEEVYAEERAPRTEAARSA